MLTVDEAMNKDVSEFNNINVKVWAKKSRNGNITLGMEAAIEIEALLDDLKSYQQVWDLWIINAKKKEGLSNQEILDMVNSFYRCPAPLDFSNTEIL